jgi:hypothetical protein
LSFDQVFAYQALRGYTSPEEKAHWGEHDIHLRLMESEGVLRRIGLPIKLLQRVHVTE